MVFMPRRVLNGGSLDGILITWDHGRHRDEVEVIEVVVQVEAKEEGVVSVSGLSMNILLMLTWNISWDDRTR